MYWMLFKNVENSGKISVTILRNITDTKPVFIESPPYSVALHYRDHLYPI